MSKLFPYNPPKSKEEMVKRLETLGQYLSTLDPFVRSIYEKFGFTAFMRSVIPCSGGEFVIQKYMEMCRPKRALVIGTNRGISTARVAQFCEHVDTIDVVASDLRASLWKHLGLSGKITDHVVKDNAAKYALIAKLDFDFCFMDGDHTLDTETDFASVRRCGNVLFHEYWENSPVVALVDCLKEEGLGMVSIEKETNFAFWTDKPGEMILGHAHADGVTSEATAPVQRSSKPKKKKGSFLG